MRAMADGGEGAPRRPLHSPHQQPCCARIGSVVKPSPPELFSFSLVTLRHLEGARHYGSPSTGNRQAHNSLRCYAMRGVSESMHRFSSTGLVAGSRRQAAPSPRGSWRLDVSGQSWDSGSRHH